MITFINGITSFNAWLSEHDVQSDQLDDTTMATVMNIKSVVQNDGDIGICKLTQDLDHVTIDSTELRVSEDDCLAAFSQVDDAYIDALKRAAKNIEEYHINQQPNQWERKKSTYTYGVQYAPIDSVGLYVPGGRAVYPSSVLMTAIPAKIAGCGRIVMVSPPTTDGSISPSVLVAAALSGVNEIYQMGGAQAVFGLAYGTQTIQPVDKIVGPGNRYVTAAKQLVYGAVDIDKPAGPSEVCVYVDRLEYARHAAAEMLAQLEHDPDASAIGIVPSNELAHAVNNEAERQLKTLKRQSIINQSKGNACIAIVETKDAAITAINNCASEHVVLISNDADNIRQQVTHAGSIFCGPYTPVALGDYYAGPNHVLPTGRSARFASPLGVMDFMKFSSYLRYSKSALQDAMDDMNQLTQAEGLDAHFQSVKIRLTDD